MQLSDRTHASDAWTEVAGSCAGFGAGSGGTAAATGSDAISGDGAGTGKATSTIAESLWEKTSSPFPASMDGTSAVADVARLSSTGAAAASNKPKSKRASASQPATAAVPHNATTTASRRTLIAPRFLPRSTSRPTKPYPGHARLFRIETLPGESA